VTICDSRYTPGSHVVDTQENNFVPLLPLPVVTSTDLLLTPTVPPLQNHSSQYHCPSWLECRNLYNPTLAPNLDKYLLHPSIHPSPQGLLEHLCRAFPIPPIPSSLPSSPLPSTPSQPPNASLVPLSRPQTESISERQFSQKHLLMRVPAGDR